MCVFNLHYIVWFAENDVSFGFQIEIYDGTETCTNEETSTN